MCARAGPSPPSSPPVPPAAAPMLVGMMQALSHSVTAISMLPRLVATGERAVLRDRARGAGGPAAAGNSKLASVMADGCSGGMGHEVERRKLYAETVEVAVMGAAVTAAGSLEIFSVMQGQVRVLLCSVASARRSRLAVTHLIRECVHACAVYRGCRPHHLPLR